ncbi:MAG TPA: PAS domain-containing sensor histidine kinase [Caldimonas sp.]|nr:PAS domain-containing sensor histidine kinase [Caldimonas sp.]HEX4233811.1 PAS domain-containing sensor histidine kinase [Caldimonas sp.]
MDEGARRDRTADETDLAAVAQLYDRAACGLLVTDADGTIRIVNATFCQWTGHARQDLIGRRRLQDLLTMGARLVHQTHWAPLLQGQGSVAEVELDLIDASGVVKPMILNAVARPVGDVVRHEIAAFGAEDRHRHERELEQARSRAEELHTRSIESQRALVSAQAELDLQKRAAEDRALLAEQMIGIVSHDLRNPLSTIQLSATVLKAHELTPKGRERVEAILRATRQSARLIGDLLDFTQARLGGGLRIRLREIEPHSVLALAIDDLRIAFPGRRLVHAMVGAGNCVADPERLAQLLGNLVSNAIVRGDPAGAVTVTSTVDDRCLRLDVHNTGLVIQDELLPTLFDATTRGRPSDAAHGAELGLFIVREIARAHGGSVTARSSVAKGTTFAAVLPRAAEPG